MLFSFQRRVTGACSTALEPKLFLRSITAEWNGLTDTRSGKITDVGPRCSSYTHLSFITFKATKYVKN